MSRRTAKLMPEPWPHALLKDVARAAGHRPGREVEVNRTEGRVGDIYWLSVLCSRCGICTKAEVLRKGKRGVFVPRTPALARCPREPGAKRGQEAIRFVRLSEVEERPSSREIVQNLLESEEEEQVP